MSAPPPRPGAAIFRWIGGRLLPRTRATAAGTALLALAGRLLALLGAWLLADGRVSAAFAVGLAAGVALLGRQAVATLAVVDCERDLHLAVSRAVLDADVLEEPEGDPHYALAEGIHAATSFVAYVAPTFAAELVAAPVAAAALAVAVPGSLLAAVAVGGVVIAVVTVALRRRVARLHAEAVRAQEALGESFTTTMQARLELVASGTVRPALDRVAAAAASYAKVAKGTALGAAILGRVPVAAALVLVFGIVLASGRANELRLDEAARPSLLLAAAVPILLNVVFVLQELLRLEARLAPFAALVQRPPRAELGRGVGRPPPVLPAPIAFADVSFAYGAGGRASRPALDGLDASWTDGVLVLHGPNGCGKSTALRLLLGLRDPDGGAVRVGSTDLRALDLAALRARIGYLPQRPYLGEPHTSVAESFALVAPAASPTEIGGALERVGLSGMAERPVGELSVGQRQRVALARVLARGAELLLLDEPDANLDTDGVDRLTALVVDLARTHMVAVAAHGPIAAALGGARWELAAGRLAKRA